MHVIDTIYPLFGRLHFFPLKVFVRERLLHRKSVQVVCIRVQDVFCKLITIMRFQVQMICFGESIHLNAQSTTDSFFEEIVHVHIGY